jgi:DNA polymerase III delta prime subunit
MSARPARKAGIDAYFTAPSPPKAALPARPPLPLPDPPQHPGRPAAPTVARPAPPPRTVALLSAAVSVPPVPHDFSVAAQPHLAFSLAAAAAPNPAPHEESRHESPVTPAVRAAAGFDSPGGACVDRDGDDAAPLVAVAASTAPPLVVDVDEDIPDVPLSATKEDCAPPESPPPPPLPKPAAAAVSDGHIAAAVVADTEMSAHPVPSPPATPEPTGSAVVIVGDSPGPPAKRAPGSSTAKRLHSFFLAKPRGADKAAAGGGGGAGGPDGSGAAERAAGIGRERAGERAAKRRRAPVVLVDPWEASDIATAHVNAPPVPPAVEGRSAERAEAVALPAFVDPFWTPQYAERVAAASPVVRRGKDGRCSDAALWSQTLSRAGNAAIDALNKAHVDDLESWLAQFYTSRTASTSVEGDAAAASRRRRGCRMDVDGSESGESGDDDDVKGDDEGVDDSCQHSSRALSDWASQCDDFGAENVCLLTGPVGSGKSTIVLQAAERLGLTVLEINAMMVRTGKRVKDTVAEALATHRIGTGKRPGPAKTQNAGFNTLIVFEEVDELAEDERGFWAAIAELSAIAGTRRPIVMTANGLTPDMRATFGDLTCDADDEIARLVGSWCPPEAGDPTLHQVKHVRVQAPSTRAMYNVLRAAVRAMGVAMDKVDKRALAGLFAEGDCRAAINALQFWSLAGEGTVAGDGLVWPEGREELAAKAYTGTASVFRSLQNVSDRIRIPGQEARNLSSWADALDVISDGDAAALDPAVERLTLPRLAGDGFDISPPAWDTDSGVSFHYSLANLLSSTPDGRLVAQAVERPPGGAWGSHNVDTRSHIRRMTLLESRARASGDGGRGKGRRTTRSTAAVKPSSFSRLSDDALEALRLDNFPRLPSS